MTARVGYSIKVKDCIGVVFVKLKTDGMNEKIRHLDEIEKRKLLLLDCFGCR